MDRFHHKYHQNNFIRLFKYKLVIRIELERGRITRIFVRLEMIQIFISFLRKNRNKTLTR